jgi:MerR family transcriptional regulator, light-induced transcriptional regulator
MTIQTFHERPPSPESGSGTAGVREPGLRGPQNPLSPEDLERLAAACLKDVHAALDLVQQWQMAGHDIEDIYLHGIAPCARLLGEWWRCDTASFAQVSIGSTNLQRLLHRLSDEFCAPGTDHPLAFSVLLAAEPQSQHTLGPFMLGEFFRRSGWHVQQLAPRDAEDVLDQLGRDWFDAIGLSVSTSRQMESLRDLLPRLRQASPNEKLKVLVGGPITQWAPEALQSLDIDLMGGDARQTVQLLGQLIAAKSN